MISIPIRRPDIVKAITIGAGVASVIVSRFFPTYGSLLHDILSVVGIGAIGAGSVQIIDVPRSLKVLE